MKNNKIEDLRKILEIPPELRIGQFILNKFPIKINIDEKLLNIINNKIKNGEKVDITKELIINLITLDDFYGKNDLDFIKK